MLRRLNRLFPPPDPEKRALEEVGEFLKFATHQEKEVMEEVCRILVETGISLEQLAEEDPRRAERFALVQKTISDRQASGVKPSPEERLAPRVRGRGSRAFAHED
jgi:hypothetical protein